jgi:hypothetical protein
MITKYFVAISIDLKAPSVKLLETANPIILCEYAKTYNKLYLIHYIKYLSNKIYKIRIIALFLEKKLTIMKKTKIIILFMLTLILFQQVAVAQLTKINTDGFDRVCYGDIIPYTFNGYAKNITSVTINPSNAGNVLFSTTNQTTIQ